MAISLHKSESIGVVVETLAYGAYLMVFLQCVKVLRGRQTRSNPSGYLLITAVILFVLVTTHLIVDIDRNMEAFESDGPNGAEKYYENLDTWKNILKSALYVAATVVSDAFIVYRSYVVWGRKLYVIPVPFLLFLADLAFGIYWCFSLTLTRLGQNFQAVRVEIFYSLTLTLNFICTALIAFRIWKIQRAVSSYSTFDSELSRVIAMIIESGAIYSAWLFILLGTYASGTPAMFIFLNSISPIIGLVFSALIVRVGLGVSAGDPHTQEASSRDLRFSSVRGAMSVPDGLQINLQQTVHTHHEDMDSESNIRKPDPFRAV